MKHPLYFHWPPALLCLAVLVISLLACPAQALQRAETGSIEGRVVRARDRQPVVGRGGHSHG